MRSLFLALCLAAPQSDPAPDFTLPGADGVPVALSSLKGRKAVVLVFGGIECPRSTASQARLADLAKKFGPQGAVFFMVNSNWSDRPEEIAEYAKRTESSIPWLIDADAKVAGLYRIEIQPTAVLLDADFKIAYRGLIDDHKVEELVRTPHLRLALEAVLAGRAPAARSTEPLGCTIKKGAPVAAAGKVTYGRQIAPILNRHCVTCHRPGQVAPFSLIGYEQARAWAPEIASYAARREMPPWKPVGNEGFYHNERRLTDGEITLLDAWSREGAPLGDEKDIPEPPKFSDAWMFGTPDAVVKAEGGYVLPAKGRDEYRCYVMDNPFSEDTWISGIEFRPGNVKSIHHILGYLDAGRQAEKKDAADPLPGYKSNGSGPMIIPSGSLSGWAPGNMPRMLPDGTARLLRKGEQIILETHYHKTGRPEKDEGSQVALYKAKGPVKKKLHVHSILNPLFYIPAGDARHKVSALWTVPKNVTAFDVMPHMHLVGREVSVTATLPDGTVRTLVAVKDWDFNWQETYQFKSPLPLPRGTKVKVEALYDNSLGNPNNPSNPPKGVRWGEQTTDEMCIAFIHFTNDREDLTKPKEGE